jgi:hypothetical protein
MPLNIKLSKRCATPAVILEQQHAQTVGQGAVGEADGR